MTYLQFLQHENQEQIVCILVCGKKRILKLPSSAAQLLVMAEPTVARQQS